MAVRINNDASVRRAIGTSGFTNSHATLIARYRLNTNRAAKFQTYHACGSDGAFGSANYYVGFDGNGATSNNVAAGIDGQDVYHASQGPIVGSLIQTALRYTDGGPGARVLKLYYDIAGVGATVTNSLSGTAISFQSDAVMVFGHAPWDEAGNDEYVDGWVDWIKAFTTNLSDADVASEAASPTIVTAAGLANVWGCWPCQYDLRDISGNGRDLTFSGTISFDPGPPPPQLRGLSFSRRPAPFKPGLAR